MPDTVDIFSTGFLMKLVPLLPQPKRHFLDRYFPAVEEQGGQFIIVERITNRPRLAPFVSPLQEGKVVESRRHTAEVIEPAYVKDKRRYDPAGSLRRMPGEAIGGSIDPVTRRRLKLRQDSEEQVEMLNNREEVMAAEFLRTGKVTITGEGFGTTVVDFRRNATHTVVLTGGARWSEVGAKPLVDIENWSTRVHDNSDAAPVEVTMAPDAWAALKARLTETELKVLLDSQRGSESRIEMGPRKPGTAMYQGRIGNFDFWTLKQTFREIDGTEVQAMPSGWVVMAAPELMGTRVYGGIYEERLGGYVDLRYYQKSWIEEDPSVRWLLMQSAPLVVPYRPDASLGAKVL
jgi:hypothetical protein